MHIHLEILCDNSYLTTIRLIYRMEFDNRFHEHKSMVRFQKNYFICQTALIALHNFSSILSLGKIVIGTIVYAVALICPPPNRAQHSVGFRFHFNWAYLDPRMREPHLN